MRHVAQTFVLAGLLSIAGPLSACENDRDTAPYEKDYQEQYEPQDYPALAAIPDADIATPSSANPYAIAGMGFGTAMLVAAVVVPALLWRRRR